MSKEFLPHVACYVCGEPVFNRDAVEIDGVYICKEEKCREEYLYRTEPKPVPKWSSNG